MRNLNRPRKVPPSRGAGHPQIPRIFEAAIAASCRKPDVSNDGAHRTGTGALPTRSRSESSTGLVPGRSAATRPEGLHVPAARRGSPGQLFDAQPGDGPGDHDLLDLLGAFEDVHGLSTASSRFTRVRDLRFRPPQSVRSTGFRRVLVPELVQAAVVTLGRPPTR